VIVDLRQRFIQRSTRRRGENDVGERSLRRDRFDGTRP
jgi:hypothetical protein